MTNRLPRRLMTEGACTSRDGVILKNGDEKGTLSTEQEPETRVRKKAKISDEAPCHQRKEFLVHLYGL
jgi:hypothetical protein